MAGATDAVGHSIAAGLLDAGHAVVALCRHPARHATPEQRGFDLADPAPALSDCAVLVHAAFAHLPGRYRGGGGDDPEGFLRLNRDGTLRQFAAARAAGVARILFLSSRAVHCDGPAGAVLTEDLPPRPDTLYGRMKPEVEQALAAMAAPGLAVASLRATGVFGLPLPGLAHKRRPLLDAYTRGEQVPPAPRPRYMPPTSRTRSGSLPRHRRRHWRRRSSMPPPSSSTGATCSPATWRLRGSTAPCPIPPMPPPFARWTAHSAGRWAGNRVARIQWTRFCARWPDQSALFPRNSRQTGGDRRFRSG